MPSGQTGKPRWVYRTHNDGVEADERIGQATGTVNDEPSLTQQQFKEDCDINVLAMRFGLTGKPVPQAMFDPAQFGDFSDVPDLRTALDLVNDAKNRFMDLPSALRYRFHNSPSELWDFVTNPENAEEAVRLGLLKAPGDVQRSDEASQSETSGPLDGAKQGT